MQEIFCEESTMIQEEGKLKRRYRLLKTLSIFFFVLAFLWFLLLFFWKVADFQENLIGALVTFLAPLILFITTGVILFKKKDGVYLTFDYTFVSGDVIISKVSMNVKRFKVAKFDTKQIVRIGKYDSEVFNNYYNSPDIKTVILTKNNQPSPNKDFYYILASLTEGKRLFVLECSENFIKNILIYTGRKVLEI